MMESKVNPVIGQISSKSAEAQSTGKFSAFNDREDLVYNTSICPVPSYTPSAFEDLSSLEPKFDPDIHLALEPPQKVTLLDFTEVKMTPTVVGNTNSPLAYTSSFRVLSAEGVRVFREILDRNQTFIRSSDRAPAFLRGLAYTSQFVRDLNECPKLLDFVSQYAGFPVVPHYLPMNYAHSNFGRLPKPGDVNKIPVDSWHVDSVPFVLILILSDMTDMEGGELQCVKRKGREPGFKLIEETGNHVDPKDLLNVNYERQGYGLFMQGCEIVHHVTPVQKAKEPRITVVNSYMPANCFAADRTVAGTFIESEKESISEFARGRAFRASQQLDAVVAQAPYTEDPAPFVDHLSRVISELQMTVDLLAGRQVQRVGYYNEVEKTHKIVSMSDSPVVPRKEPPKAEAPKFIRQHTKGLLN